MTEQQIYDGVVANGTIDFIDTISMVRRHEARWCIIDDFAVNCYTKPVYTAELALVVEAADLGPVLANMRVARFSIKELPSTVLARRPPNPGERTSHKLTVRFAKDDRCQSMIERAVLRPVFGQAVPVASLADVVQGKLWTRSDPMRRASTHAKDHFDLLRLAEERFNEVVPLLPAELRDEAEANRQHRLLAGDNGWGDDDQGGT